MKAPIEMMLDGVTWVPAVEERPTGPDNSDGIPFVTHEGVLDLMGYQLRCYRLSSGQTVFNAEDIETFFADLADDTPPPQHSTESK